MRVVGKQSNSRMCIICGMDNPIGLHAQFYNMEDGSVVTPFSYTENHQSFPQRVHGGLVASMLDELGLRALWAKGDESVFGVTMSLEVKYRQPVPYGEELFGRGILEKETSKFAAVRAEIYNKAGKLLAEAAVKYIKMNVGQIAENVDPHEEMCYLMEDDVKEIWWNPDGKGK